MVAHEGDWSAQESGPGPAEQSEGPLAGIRVADFSRILAGPQCAMILGDLGADVIKVERPDGGDDTRSWGEPIESDYGTYFLASNRNKRSITLDLTAPDDQRRARTLIELSDVLVENFRHGAMEEFGLGPEELAERNPSLIHCSVSGFGRGQGAWMPGYDLLAQASSGLMSLTGSPDGEPTKVGVAICDVITALHAAIGVLASLYARCADGQGERLDVNLLSSTLASLVNQASMHLVTGDVPGRLGNLHPSISPYETFSCRDRSLVVAIGTQRQFGGLCRALGLPELASEKRFASNRSRVEARFQLRALLQERFQERTADEWLQLLRGEGVPCSEIHDVEEAFAFAVQLGLDAVEYPPKQSEGGVPQVSSPLGLARRPPVYRREPPRLGEHDAQIRAWLDRAASSPSADAQAGPSAVGRADA